MTTRYFCDRGNEEVPDGTTKFDVTLSEAGQPTLVIHITSDQLLCLADLKYVLKNGTVSET